MLKQMLASTSVTIPLHIPYVPDISILTNVSTTSESNETHTPTYENLHIPLLSKKESKNNYFPYKKYLMAFIKIVNECRLLEINRLVQLFSFWLEEGVIYL